MIRFGQDVCGNLEAALRREWLETNGLGGFASSTINGINTRRYHGLLVAARALLIAVVIHTVDVAMSVFGLKLQSHRDTMNVLFLCHLSERSESHA
jgi:glycogen debranching enzyme